MKNDDYMTYAIYFHVTEDIDCDIMKLKTSNMKIHRSYILLCKKNMVHNMSVHNMK